MTTKGNVGVHNVVPTVYDGVINEVISSVKDDFINEGLDESVLEELKKLWKKKLHESRALEDPQEKKKVSNTKIIKHGVEEFLLSRFLEGSKALIRVEAKITCIRVM